MRSSVPKKSWFLGLMAIVFVALLGCAVIWLFDRGATSAAQGSLREHIQFELRAGLDKQSLLHLFGPDAASMANVDKEGLRLVVPGDRKKTGVVGLASELRLRGDFAVILEYELLAVPDPAPPRGSGVQLLVKFEGDHTTGASVWRMQRANGPMFGASYNPRGPDGKEQYKALRTFAAREPNGKLRIERAGKQLFFQVADGAADFRHIADVDIESADVTMVRAQIATGGAQETVDARFVALDLRADEMPNKTALINEPGSLRSLTIVGILLSSITIAYLSVWYGVRWSRRNRCAARSNQVAASPLREGHEQSIR